MKQIFTLIVLFVSFFQSTKTAAQYNQNFNSVTTASLADKCWQLDNTTLEGPTSQQYLQISLAKSNSASFTTPYIQPNATSLSLSFTYNLSGKLGKNSYRTITVSNGSTIVGTIDLTSSSPETAQTATFTTTISSLGAWPSFTFAVEGSGDLNNVKVQIDNLSITGLNNVTNCSAPSEGFVPLPVSLTNFTGSIVNQQAQLAWSVAENQEGEAFEVEKSNDGRNFTTIARVKITLKAGAEQYNFADTRFNATAYYRLKVINKNAAASYSKTIVLQEKGVTGGNKLTLQQNPVVSTINFSYNAAAAGAGTVSLYTTSGVKVYSTSMNMQRGLTQAALSTDSKVTPGAYILEVVHGSERSLVKLVKL